MNGALGVVHAMHTPPGALEPTVVEVRLLDEPDGAPHVHVRREQSTTRLRGGIEYTRSMFPLIPALAVTVVGSATHTPPLLVTRHVRRHTSAVCMCEQHRVQGVTLTGEVHVLLNKEFFAEGASHCRTLHVQHMKRPLHN